MMSFFVLLILNAIGPVTSLDAFTAHCVSNRPPVLPPWPSSTSISSPSYITSLAAMRVFFPIARIPLICSLPPLHPCRPLNLILSPCFPPPRQVLRPLRSPHARQSSCLTLVHARQPPNVVLLPCYPSARHPPNPNLFPCPPPYPCRPSSLIRWTFLSLLRSLNSRRRSAASRPPFPIQLPLPLGPPSSRGYNPIRTNLKTAEVPSSKTISAKTLTTTGFSSISRFS